MSDIAALRYTNHSGLFRLWSKRGPFGLPEQSDNSSIHFCDYAGQDVLGRHQFKMTTWLGASAYGDWQGTPYWDWDDVFLLEGGGVWHFPSVMAGGLNYDGETISKFARFTEYPGDLSARLLGEFGLREDLSPEELLDVLFCLQGDAFSLLDAQTPPELCALDQDQASDLPKGDTGPDFVQLFNEVAAARGYVGETSINEPR